MEQHWLVVGTQRNWQFSFENGNLWGLKDFRESKALWNLLREGDKLLIYVSKPVSGIVGVATVTTKIRQTQPLWPEEVRRGCVIWPLRFEFSVDYCIPPSLWISRCFRDEDLQLITRMVFQCVPIELVEATKAHLGLQIPRSVELGGSKVSTQVVFQSSLQDHDLAKKRLREIGRIQGYLAEEEYPIEGGRLDVVWRRVERSVPTYAFEVQVGGDIYHALAKLKHAYDLWNSHIFLAAPLSARPKYEELTTGSFNEIGGRIDFLELSAVDELYKRKTSYFELERQLRMKF